MKTYKIQFTDRDGNTFINEYCGTFDDALEYIRDMMTRQRFLLEGYIVGIVKEEN